MRRTWHLLTTIVLLLTLHTSASAFYLFKTLDARDGLTSSQVNCILKDQRGFMWFGTPAGLYRYDGYTFKNFQCDSQDGSSLPDSYINTIQESLDGTLWVSTASGYCIYHPQTETFERDMKQTFGKMNIERVPSIIYIDRHKNLWGVIPNKGVICYNMQQQLLYEFGYTNDALGIPQGNVCSISECRDGALIVYDDGRIVCCDVMHQQHTVWQTDDIANRKLRRTRSLKAFADQKDNIWLYGRGTLFMYNKTAKTWDTNIGNQLGLTSLAVDNTVNDMDGDKQGNIWIGTDRAGLVKMNVNTLQMEPVQPKNNSLNQFHSDLIRVQSIYVDDTDLLWVGTEKSGVAYSGEHIYRFESLLNGDITAMAQDASGQIWYGTSDRGVLGIEAPLTSSKVSALEWTSDGSLWVGSNMNGLTRIRNGQSTIYSVARDSMATIIDDRINDLCTDKVGNLWIATKGGLQVYNPKMNTFSAYTRENGKLSTNSITSLFYTKDNRMLVGTGEGLFILSLSNSESKHLTGNISNLKRFTNNYITQIYQDSRDLIWIGTREGLNILNPDNDELDYLTEKQGLCNNNICGIAEDKKHNIWVTTSNGACRIVVNRDHETGSFAFGLYNYNVSDGLQSNEFNPGSILTKDDGDVLLGGLHGINWVRHDKASGETVLKVMLTQLFIGEEEIKIGHEYGGHVLLNQALNETTKLELNHDQNTFTIKFAAGNYNQSERLQFMYQLKGHDDEWRNGDALKHGVTFHNLKSGTYTLMVKAVSAEGAVSTQERTLEIVIKTHWLLSWWMIMVYVLVFLLILYIWKIGLRQIKEIKTRKQAIIEELISQREEIKAASDDLRQPMARMTSIIGNLSENKKTLEEREQLNALHSQMLQVITRVSDMQTMLEHPEERARQSVRNRFELNSKGEINMPVNYGRNETLTSEYTMRSRRTDAPTSHILFIFIDDNDEFLKFVSSNLRDVYDIHVYNDTRKAAEDMEVFGANIVVCKHNMKGMSGSELCNRMKMSTKLSSTIFVLMTDGVLTPQDMKMQNVTMAADDYIAKPFNLQEAIMRFNKLLGLGPVNVNMNLIEGAETRMLEDRNASMTTATETIDPSHYRPENDNNDDTTIIDEMSFVETPLNGKKDTNRSRGFTMSDEAVNAQHEETISDYSMLDAVDQQLMKNIEQYVLQNMSRGQISLEEMSTAMGMGRVPFFHKIRNLTGKTPTELVRDLRLKHACILLKRTNINMSELATNVGFITAENFINVFKERFGLSPLEYRLKHRR